MRPSVTVASSATLKAATYLSLWLSQHHYNRIIINTSAVSADITPYRITLLLVVSGSSRCVIAWRILILSKARRHSGISSRIDVAFIVALDYENRHAAGRQRRYIINAFLLVCYEETLPRHELKINSLHASPKWKRNEHVLQWASCFFSIEMPLKAISSIKGMSKFPIMSRQWWIVRIKEIEVASVGLYHDGPT